MNVRIYLTIGSLLIVPHFARAQEAKPEVLGFRVTVDGNIKLTNDAGGKSNRRTIAEVDYRNARTKDGVDVGVDRFGFRVLNGNQEIDQLEVSRTRLTSRRIDRPLDVTRSAAGPGLLAVFEQFDPPLLSIKLDSSGGETSRKTKDELGPLLGARMVDLTRLFHPRFPAEESKWEAPIVLPFGRGQHGTGALRYAKKGEPDKDGKITVDVTGFLKVTGTHDVAEIKRGEYKVAGTQVYDPKLREWVSGKLTVAVGWDAQLPNGMTIHGDGPATYTLTRREGSAKTKGSARKSNK